MYSWRIQSASFLVRLQESKGRFCIVITKKGKIVSKGKTPLIGLASERQQSPLLRVKEQKMMAEQGRGWKKKTACAKARVKTQIFKPRNKTSPSVVWIATQTR